MLSIQYREWTVTVAPVVLCWIGAGFGGFGLDRLRWSFFGVSGGEGRPGPNEILARLGGWGVAGRARPSFDSSQGILVEN